jgi:hypothetical protein
VGEALCRDEGILYAEIDLAQSVEPKQFHDVVDSYNRFDIFTLTVNRSPRRPATFIDERQDFAGSKVPPACDSANPRTASKASREPSRAQQTRQTLGRLIRSAALPGKLPPHFPSWRCRGRHD